MSDGVVQLVFDDAEAVPAAVSSVTGVERFGQMIRARARLGDTARALASEAKLGALLVIEGPADRAAVAEAVSRQPASTLYLVLPSFLAPTVARPAAVHFLSKLRYLTEPVALWQGTRATEARLRDRDGMLAFLRWAQDEPAERARLLAEEAASLAPVQDALGLADLRRLPIALEFLSGSFTARHFNQVRQDRYHVVKRSSDKAKIRREHAFWTLLPPSMQPYFVQPFDHREDADGAEYRMRRLFVPDLAVQWVHRAFTPEQFEQLLAHLFHFLDERPRWAVGRARVAEVARELYVAKLRARIAQLDALPVGRQVEATLVAGGLVGGVGSLLERYLALYDALAPRRRDAELSVSHGDLGFSNVLYSSATQTFQLIDPRGADTAEELFSDPYYDVAKLSHSILGDYDFLVAGFYQLVHDEHLGLTLTAEGPPAELRELFLVALAENGYDLDLARLGEASLFLSMLPLHADSPKRVTAFALRARSIIDELEARR